MDGFAFKYSHVFEEFGHCAQENAHFTNRAALSVEREKSVPFMKDDNHGLRVYSPSLSYEWDEWQESYIPKNTEM